MNNIKIVFQYDGSSFYGYQRQPGLRTVQGEIEKVIKNVFNQKIDMVSAGRTDRGVHALGQTANFLIDQNIPVERIVHVLNTKLSGDILIKSVEKVSRDFHSRFSAKRRTYLYLIKDRSLYSVFDRNYYTYLEKIPESSKLKTVLKQIEGKHDFNGFRKSSCGAANSVREIFEVDILEEKEYLKIRIVGNSFLKSMVRIVMGYAIEEALGEKAEGFLKKVLENPNIERQKILAPSQGLYLHSVEYQE